MKTKQDENTDAIPLDIYGMLSGHFKSDVSTLRRFALAVASGLYTQKELREMAHDVLVKTEADASNPTRQESNTATP